MPPARNGPSASITTSTRHRTRANATTAASGARASASASSPGRRKTCPISSPICSAVALSAGSGTSQEFHARGPDLRYHLEVSFLDAARGAKRAVTMPDGKNIEITIPVGVRDGQTLRLRGKGAPGHGKGPAGDALVTITVAPHPVFTRDGDDIEVELPVTFDEAVLGAKVDVPTISRLRLHDRSRPARLRASVCGSRARASNAARQRAIRPSG